MPINANLAAKTLIDDECTLPAPVSPPAHDVEALTRNEEIVYKELQRPDGPKKAYALLDALHEQGVRAPMTIYRALDGLIAKGLAKKITSLNAYAAVLPDSRRAVTAYVTCRRCGKTYEISLAKDEIARMLAPTSITLSEVFIEAFGDCESAPDACVAKA